MSDKIYSDDDAGIDEFLGDVLNEIFLPHVAEIQSGEDLTAERLLEIKQRIDKEGSSIFLGYGELMGLLKLSFLALKIKKD